MKSVIVVTATMLIAGVAVAADTGTDRVGRPGAKDVTEAGRAQPPSAAPDTLGPRGEPSMAATMPPQHNAGIATRDKSPIGPYLTDASGRSLYMFEGDERGKQSKCTEGCLDAWPAVVVDRQPQPGKGVDPKLVGTIHRPAGALQLTYDGWPLYHFAGDSKPGDAAGQALKDFGAHWYVMAPDGQPIHQTGEKASLGKD